MVKKRRPKKATTPPRSMKPSRRLADGPRDMVPAKTTEGLVVDIMKKGWF